MLSRENQASTEKPKWWECGGHVRGKKQSRESDAAGERGASGQDVTDERRASSFVPSGHRPGLMSDLGGVAGCWLSKPRQGAPVRTKEAARVAQNFASNPCPRTASDVAPGPYPPSLEPTHSLERPLGLPTIVNPHYSQALTFLQPPSTQQL